MEALLNWIADTYNKAEIPRKTRNAMLPPTRRDRPGRGLMPFPFACDLVVGIMDVASTFCASVAGACWHAFAANAGMLVLDWR